MVVRQDPRAGQSADLLRPRAFQRREGLTHHPGEFLQRCVIQRITRASATAVFHFSKPLLPLTDMLTVDVP